MIYKILGLMSGTSLDGLDIALCEFNTEDYKNFKILKTKTTPFPEHLKIYFRKSLELKAVEYIFLHKSFAEYCAAQVNLFLGDEKIDFIASHGHTSIHLPKRNINFQLGDGATMSALTGYPVVCDFRSTDIALGGQGAPLVPIGEKYLFPQYDTFLNIGGFSNISLFRESLIAYDVCPANYVLNFYARKQFMDFDKDGIIGRSGRINKMLLNELNSLDYYTQKAPKSLSDHWVREYFFKINEKYSDIADVVRTCYENISTQIAKNLDENDVKKVLVTGGGAYNTFLMQLIKDKTKAKLVVPDKSIVEYKEALIFAFLGLLRWINQPNCLASVTGASKDNVGGAIYFNSK